MYLARKKSELKITIKSITRRDLRGETRTVLAVAFADVICSCHFGYPPLKISVLFSYRRQRVRDKFLYGANSPSLCPACFRMQTGTCFRPSYTAIVNPIKLGKDWRNA